MVSKYCNLRFFTCFLIVVVEIKLNFKLLVQVGASNFNSLEFFISL